MTQSAIDYAMMKRAPQKLGVNVSELPSYWGSLNIYIMEERRLGDEPYLG